MIDQHNRDINYLRISVTDRCNLRCLYCMPKEGLSLIGHDDILRYEEILKIIRVAVKLGISKVRITGGEPLVRRGIVDFIDRLKSIEGLNDVSLTTNGIRLVEFADKLYRAGMTRINVSLDSLNPQKYAEITRGGSLEAVLRGIDSAYRVGFSPIKINTVAIKGANDDEILDFANLTLDKPFQVRFIEMMALGGSGDEQSRHYLSNDLVMEKINRAYRLEPINGRSTNMDGPAKRYRISGGTGEIGFISPVSQHFCHHCNRLRLTADGHLRACLLLDDEVDLKGPLRENCDDDVLEMLIKKTIMGKPRGHSMVVNGRHLRKCVKEMSAIGG
jgi:cyclic pyranopterin phosphate synthase